MSSITIPQEYGYVLATISTTLVNGIWHGIRIGSFRKAAGVSYPTPYADSAMLAAATTPERKLALHRFNCAQRAHGNFLENSTAMIAASAIAGLRYPIATAVLGAAWNVGRILYAVGYAEKEVGTGKGRVPGSAIQFLSIFGLVGMAGWTAAAVIGLV